MKNLYTILFALLLLSATSAQDKWDVSNPDLGESTSHSFTTSEGTWMNLDVSPDGKQIEIKYKKLQNYLNRGYTQVS